MFFRNLKFIFNTATKLEKQNNDLLTLARNLRVLESYKENQIKVFGSYIVTFSLPDLAIETTNNVPSSLCAVRPIMSHDKIKQSEGYKSLHRTCKELGIKVDYKQDEWVNGKDCYSDGFTAPNHLLLDFDGMYEDSTDANLFSFDREAIQSVFKPSFS